MKGLVCALTTLIFLCAAELMAQHIEAQLSGNTAAQGFSVINQAGDTLFTTRGDHETSVTGHLGIFGSLGLGGTALFNAPADYTGSEFFAHPLRISDQGAEWLCMGADDNDDCAYLQSIGSNTLHTLALNPRGGKVGIHHSAPLAQLHVHGAEGFLVTTPSQSGTALSLGQGVRLHWYPKKSAFRVGLVSGTQWDDTNIGGVSVAMGRNTIASGSESTALGFSSKATGNSSTAFGSSTEATGGQSTAMGYSSQATGMYSTAMGNGTTASGQNSTAMGYHTTANDNYSTAMGKNTTASGESATATGNGCTASGDNAYAMGDGCTASGDNAFASGYHSTAGGLLAFAMGMNASASSSSAVAIGSDVTASGNFSTAMGRYVSTNGKTGSFIIGDASTVTTALSSQDNQFKARFDGGYIFYTNSSLTVGAYLTGTSWGSLSDSTKKERFLQIDGQEVLKKFRSLRLGSWRYKTGEDEHVRHYGPMAQEWFQAFGDDGIGQIGCDTLLASADVDGVLCIAVQALEERTSENNDGITSVNGDVATLRAQLKAKDAEIARLQDEIESMRKANTRRDEQYHELVRLVHNLQQAQMEQDQRQALLLDTEAGQ